MAHIKSISNNLEISEPVFKKGFSFMGLNFSDKVRVEYLHEGRFIGQNYKLNHLEIVRDSAGEFSFETTIMDPWHYEPFDVSGFSSNPGLTLDLSAYVHISKPKLHLPKGYKLPNELNHTFLNK